MKMNRIARRIFLFAFLLMLGMPYRANAATYTWKWTEDGELQCYKNETKLVRNKWVNGRHLNANGYMDRNTWVKKDGIDVFVRNDGKVVKKLKNGWQNIKGKYYFYTKSGELMTGWIKYKNKMYYADPLTKARVTGLNNIKERFYCFSSNGVLKTNKKFTYKGKEYIADARGVCTPVLDESSPSADLLFFLTFESGSEAYNQTGGDHGNACGAYQFDNRYSLLPFVKYAYAQNPLICKEFKKYASYTNGTKLKSNTGFYRAWNTIYMRAPAYFAQLQDSYAKSEYYDPVERMLSLAGIDLASRPDVVKGAVYSYSIQHGQMSAVNAVKACKVKNTMKDEVFLKRLYAYRMKSFPLYKSRYYSELALALSKLRAASK